MENKKIKVVYGCPACGNNTELNLDKYSYSEYMSSDKSIMECFPNENSFVRETMISKLCFDCQSKIFHRPKPGEDNKWGKYLGSCLGCDRPVYEADIKNGSFMCDSCGGTGYQKAED